MGTQNKEIKIALDIQAKIDKASAQIGNLKKQIDNFELSKSLTSEFAKEFKNIENELAELQRKTASGEINLIDAKSAEKEIDKIEKRWAFLLNKIGDNSFLEKGLKADAQAMSALESLAKTYANSIKEAEAQETKLNKKLEEAKQKQKEITEAQKAQKVVKASELEDQKAQLAILEKQEKAAKKNRDEAEKALRAKVEESSGKYTMDEVSRKGSNLRKTDAYKAFRDAQSVYESAKTSTRTQKTNIGSMVTKEMQTAEATAAQEAIDKATEALENYRKTSLATAREDAFKNAKESLKTIAEFKDVDWKGLGIDISEIKSVEDLEKALAKLRIEADNRANEAIKEIGTSTEEASQGFKVMERDVKNAKESLEEMDEQARQTAAFETKIKQFLGMAGAVELLRRALRQAFETTKELDAAMTEMAVVTDLEVGDYWNQLPEHTKRANELGVAIKGVYEAETLYYQQGLKTAEAQSLANETLKMARIAGMDAAEATDKMTAALRGFNMELNEASAQKVADVYSELAAITAADVNEISSAMTKTASIASSAGMEFETTAAFLSQIIETTRESAETAGTAMKTVIARFQELKKSPDEIGEIDGEIVDANAIETALRSVGVSLRDSSGQFRELDEVFLELSSKWSSLDKNTQRYIATIAAGSRQQSRFIAMMSDYGRTQDLVTAANNSAGASQRQYEKTLESLETKLAKLKNTWDEFSMGILESDLVKFGVEALTKLLEIVNKATSAFDGMGGTIMKVLTTILMFKIGQSIFEKIKSPMMRFGEELKNNFFNFGKEAGKAFAEGSKQGMAEARQEGLPKQSDKDVKEEIKEETKEKESLKQKFYNSTGISNFKKSAALQEKIDKKTGVYDKKQNLKNAKNRLKDVKNNPNASTKETYKAEESYKRAQENLKKAEAEKKKYIASDEELKKQSQEAWEEVGKGISQAGQAIAGVGIGVSMLGGLFSSLGLEEVGNVVSVIGTGIAFIGSMLSAIPPLLTIITAHPIIAIITGICLLIISVITLIASAVKNSSIEAKMQRAAEATEKAREAAEETKKAYDDMIADRQGFDEMQKKLAGLTKGTQEWKEALRESNAQVLDLIATYPDLAKYLTRGDQGQLMISDAGWDKMIADQERAVANAQSVVGYRQMNELDLEIENSEAKVEKTNARYYHKDKQGYTVYDENGVAMFDELDTELKELVNSPILSYEEVINQATELSKKYKDNNGHLIKTEEEIKKIVDDLYKSKEEIANISDQIENIARANLTAMASEDLLDSRFGDQAIDAFANSLNSDKMDKAIQDRVNETTDADSSKGVSGEEEFTALAEKYGVDDDIVSGSGNDEDNTRKLYKAVIGAEAGDGMSVDEMLKAIYAADETNKLTEQMEAYANTLAKIGDQNVAGLLSNNGDGMTGTFAKEFMDSDGKTFDRSKVDAIADQYFGSVEAWAASVGKTTEELYDEIEENVRGAIVTNEATFGRFKRALGSTDESLDKFGTKVQISTENSVNLIDKIVGVSQKITDDEAIALKGSLDTVLDAAGDKAEMLAGIVGTMNWNSADAWKELPEIVDNMGIAFEDGGEALKAFIEQAGALEFTVKTVDLKKLTSEIQNMYDTLKALQSGEQGRDFDEDTYNQLVTSNSDLKDSFVQIGDKFKYIGGSMDNLANALIYASKEQMAIAQVQMEQSIKVAGGLQAFDDKGGVAFGGKILKASEGGSAEWAKEEQIAYLEAFRANASELGVDTLQFLTGEDGEGLGITLGTNFQELSTDQLDAVMKALEKNLAEAPELSKALAKQIEDSKIADRLFYTFGQNLQASRNAETEEQRNVAAKAFSIQAAESGQVADAVIGRYNDIIAGKAEKVETGERERLEKIMEEGLERANQNLEAMKTIQETTNRVAEALYNIGQAEIDKMSQLNDSINEANDKLLNKIQEQINDERQAREQEKALQNLTDKESRLAYLMRDTSGANDLEIQQLQKELSQEQESYGDSLVDQSLENLQQTNEQAAEQRERQIELMQAQLDLAKSNGDLQLKAEQAVEESVNAINSGEDPLGTQVGKILAEEAGLQGKMTEASKDALNAEISETLVDTANATAVLGNSQGTSSPGSIQGLVDTINKKIKAEEESADTERIQQNKRENIVSSVAASIKSGNMVKGSASYNTQMQEYTSAGGSANQFESEVRARTGGQVGSASMIYKADGWDDNAGKEWDQGITLEIGGTSFSDLSAYQTDKKGRKDTKEAALKRIAGQGGIDVATINNALGIDGSNGDVVLYQGQAYILLPQWGNNFSMWMPLWIDSEHRKATEVASAIQKMNAFKTGGLADFTGPAWLDGTKSHPELVLNARDTQNFIQLKDILAEVMSRTTPTDSNKTSSGDNYFDIDISVESLSDDYDVEQLADKIRSMIYNDSMYRNVNTVNLIR